MVHVTNWRFDRSASPEAVGDVSQKWVRCGRPHACFRRCVSSDTGEPRLRIRCQPTDTAPSIAVASPTSTPEIETTLTPGTPAPFAHQLTRYRLDRHDGFVNELHGYSPGWGLVCAATWSRH